MSIELMKPMRLYPQPIQQSVIEYLPVEIPHRRRL
jgi:hypothetical protein